MARIASLSNPSLDVGRDSVRDSFVVSTALLVAAIISRAIESSLVISKDVVARAVSSGLIESSETREFERAAALHNQMLRGERLLYTALIPTSDSDQASDRTLAQIIQTAKERIAFA